MINLPKNSESMDYEVEFVARYRREFGFVLTTRSIIVDDIRVRGIGKGFQDEGGISLGVGESGGGGVEKGEDGQGGPAANEPAVPRSFSEVYFEEMGHRVTTGAYVMEDLRAGHRIAGPAIIMQNVATIVVEPGCVASVTPSGDIKIEVESVQNKRIGTLLDSIHLSIFSHRFMGTSDDCSISVSMKTSSSKVRLYITGSLLTR